jgi:hypothetical protein
MGVSGSEFRVSGRVALPCVLGSDPIAIGFSVSGLKPEPIYLGRVKV